MAGTIITDGIVDGIIVATGDGIADGITAIGAGITGAGTVTGKLFALKPKQARLAGLFSVHAAGSRC
jgi:hypothetical protein